MTAYPPEPWDLTGRGWITLWHVDAGRLPALPPGARPLRLGRHALAFSAFVDYDESGLLAYHELLAGVPVRQSRRVGLCITHIVVDSPASRAGGRDLWGIPKELATFASPTTAHDGDQLLAEASFAAPRRTLRLPQVLRSRTIQPPARHSRLLAGGRVGRTRAAWTVPADGPLGWLADARPLLHLAAPAFSLRFGPRLGPGPLRRRRPSRPRTAS